jgi:cytochrome c oxidase subunit 2
MRRGIKRRFNIEGNMTLEIAWTIIPLFLVAGMFWYGYLGYDALATPPAKCLQD